VSTQEQAFTPDNSAFEPLYGGKARVEGMGMKLEFAPWDIEAPQPKLVEVERAGGFGHTVIDAGCGAGENAIYLAGQGHRVTGVDGSSNAVATAAERARAYGVELTLGVADATTLDDVGSGFDTALDWGLFHCLEKEQQRLYAEALHRVCGPGATWQLFCFTESSGAGLPMKWLRVSHADLHASLDGYWRVRSIEETSSATRLTREILEKQRRDSPEGRLPFDPDALDVDEQGRILMPISHIHAERM
jgi:ubiquinone/menaquinone biosynthesis C-methylase UbiE